MATLAFDAEQIRKVLNTLEEIVAEAGADYVYPRNPDAAPAFQCEYVRGDKPSCLAGRVLHRLGMPLGELSAYEGRACNALHTPVLSSTLAKDVLREAQVVQDKGETWGAALARARAHAATQYGVRQSP